MFVGRLVSEVPKCLEIMTGAILDKEIVELNIGDNAFGPIGVQSIEHCIKSLKTLKKLLIANNGLGPVCFFLTISSRNNNPYPAW